MNKKEIIQRLFHAGHITFEESLTLMETPNQPVYYPVYYPQYPVYPLGPTWVYTADALGNFTINPQITNPTTGDIN